MRGKIVSLDKNLTEVPFPSLTINGAPPTIQNKQHHTKKKKKKKKIEKRKIKRKKHLNHRRYLTLIYLFFWLNTLLVLEFWKLYFLVSVSIRITDDTSILEKDQINTLVKFSVQKLVCHNIKNYKN
jgi:hypothetical protein